jgi:hypothetical protein
MKKIMWVAAILLALIFSLVYRQLIESNGKQYPLKAAVPAAMQESMILSSLLIQ